MGSNAHEDNNFNEESKAHELWEKIDIMFQNKNVANQVSIFRKLVRLRYQDGSSMAEHLNAFQGLIHQATSLEVPLADEVLALFLLSSLPDSWETLVVTLGTAGPEGKRLSLARVKSSLLDEEARRLQSAPYRIGTRKTKEPESPEPGEVGDTV